MKVSDSAKPVWWVVVVVLLGCILLARSEAILAGDSSSFDMVVFVSWLAVLASPLFDEVTFFGVQLRRQIDEVRTQLTREIAELKTEVRTSINLRASVGHQITVIEAGVALPSPAQIREMEPLVRRTVEDTMRSYGVQRAPDEAEIALVPETASYLFGVRYNLEGELRRIWERVGFREEWKAAPSVGRILNMLMREEVLDPELVFVIRQVYAICNAAVHGETISAEQRQFVAEAAPGVIVSLRAITVELVPLNEA